MNNKLEKDIRKNFAQALNNFDFSKVSDIMDYLNWTWHGEEYPPTKAQMITMIDELFSNAIEGFHDEVISVSSGGFRIIIYKLGKVEILFIPAYSHSYD